MKKLLTLFLLIFALSLVTNSLFSQTSKLEGTWELVKRPLPQGIPFFTVLKVIDKNGNYSQIRVTDKGSFIWQIAKLKVLNDTTLRETINYCMNPSMLDKTYNCSYELSEDENKHKLLSLQGGKKLVGGVETFEWKELWKKVETSK